MEKLSLADYSVAALKPEEAIKISGGFGIIPIITFASAMIYIYNNQDDIEEGFEEGFMSTYDGD